MSTVVRAPRRLRAAIVAIALLLAALPMGDVAAAPATSHTIDPSTPFGANGWYRGPVKVTLDGGADAVRTEYRVDGGAWQVYSGTEKIFDGTEASFRKWKMAPSGSFQLLPDGTMLTRDGLGMLWYPKEYGDISLKFEWRDVNPTGRALGPVNGYGNSGVFARFPNPDEVVATPSDTRPACGNKENGPEQSPAWIAIRCGQEFQIYDGPGGEVQKTGSVYNFKPLSLEQAKPGSPGAWNTYELRLVGDGDYTATVLRNGEVINEFKNTPGQVSSRAGDPPTDQRQFARGFIGLQNHGRGDLIQFREITVTTLGRPDPIVITKQGRHTLEYRSVDSAGAIETAKSVPINIDYGAPTTTARLTPADPGAGGTYSGPVKVALDVADGEGVVERTEYRVDGGAWQTYAAPEVSLFDGTEDSLSKWAQAGPGSFELTEERTLRTSGGLGMLWYPQREFGDAALKMQFREARQDGGFSNSGVFMRFPRPEGRPNCELQGRPAWVAIGCGHEIQIYDGPSGEGQKTGSIYNFQPLNLTQAKPSAPGEWNDYEIRTVGGGSYTVTVLRNGEVINTFVNSPGKMSSRPGDPPTDLRQFASGYIGLQNHGSSDVMEFRNIRVQDLSPDAAAFTVSSPGAHTVEFRSTDAAGHVEPIRRVTFSITG